MRLQPLVRVEGMEGPVEGRLGWSVVVYWIGEVRETSVGCVGEPCFVLAAGLREMPVRRSPRQMLLHSPKSTSPAAPGRPSFPAD